MIPKWSHIKCISEVNATCLVKLKKTSSSVTTWQTFLGTYFSFYIERGGQCHVTVSVNITQLLG